MNIVILNDFAYVDGGASKIALGSAAALAKRGHRVLLFTAVGPVSPELEEIAGLETRCLHQYEIVQDPQRLRAAVHGLWNRNAAVQFGRTLQTFSPRDTVIHLHTWTKALSASVVRVAVDLGFPVVLTLHDYFSACPTGSFFIHPTRSICRLRPMSAACIGTQCDSRNYGHKLWRVGREWLGNHPGRLPSGIRAFMSISSLSEQILRPYLPPGRPVYRVPNFIEVEKSTPANVLDNSGFCFVGRLSPEKGPLLAAECAQRLGLDMVFVGSGPQQAEISKLAPNALFTGWLAPMEVHAAIARSRALVFPSLWYETQGLVVAEAAALGVPAIVASTSAAREWVEDGVTGLIFRGGDANDLAEKMTMLHSNPELARSMGEESYRRYWQSPVTSERHCEELEVVYGKVSAGTEQGAATL